MALLREGQVFAGFVILGPLGTGGMGEVYLATHPRLPRPEALKVLSAEASVDHAYRQRFNREADLAIDLDVDRRTRSQCDDHDPVLIGVI